MEKNIKVKLNTNFLMPVERQTVQGNGKWQNCQFYTNAPVKECDFWVIFEGLPKEEYSMCPRGNTIFITAEPPTIRKYSQSFLKQFAYVITCDRNIKHKNPIFQHQGLPWHIGRRKQDDGQIKFSNVYDEMKSINSFRKVKEISLISSAKDVASGHRKRIAFINYIKNHFKKKIDIFGRGFYEIEDKWDAIASYKYHVVIENSSFKDYWTEKLSDAFLGCAYPIYYGCKNIYEYFSPDALTSIDIDNFEYSISIMNKIIRRQQYEKSVEAIIDARNLVLDKYNLFAMISELCNEIKINTPKVQIKLYPEEYFLNSFTKRYIKSLLTYMKKCCFQ